jgi:hypothetical protein
MSAAARLAALPLVPRRVIALALLVLLLLLAWFTVVLPLGMALSSQTGWRDNTARTIARDRGMVAAAKDIREVAAAVESSPLRARFYETGGLSPVEDAVKNDLRSALLAAGVEPTTFKVLPAVATRGLRAHRVEFSTVVTVDQLQSFFVAVEGQPRYLRIERLRLDAPSNQRSDENPRVTALMEVRGYSVDGPAPQTQTRVARAY